MDGASFDKIVLLLKMSQVVAKNVGKTAVIVGAVTDDIRLTELPALKV
jgi:hypothetical protein